MKEVKFVATAPHIYWQKSLQDLSKVWTHELEKGKLRGLSAVLVYESGCQVAAKDGLDVRLGNTLQESVKSNLVKENAREGLI